MAKHDHDFVFRLFLLGLAFLAYCAFIIIHYASETTDRLERIEKRWDAQKVEAAK